MSKPPGIVVETYRGCDIYWYKPGTWYTYAVFDSPCVPDESFRVPANLFAAIDDALGPEVPPEPYQPIGEYRDCIILMWVEYSPLQFSSSCTPTRRFTPDQVYQDIDDLLGPVPEPEPEPEEDAFIETYQGYDIYRRPDEGMFYAVITDVITAIGLTLQACRDSIDEYLESMEPEEDPPTGIFAQVVAALKSWVNGIIGSAISGVKTWVRNVVKAAIDAVDWVITEVTEFIDNSIIYWTEEITNVYNDLRRYYDNSVTYINDSVNYWGDQITQNITNVIGASTEWVDERLTDNRAWVQNLLKLSDPFGFLKDPLGTVKAAWELWRAAGADALIKSFLEGFEEGLAE